MKLFKFKNDEAGAGTIEYVVLAASAVLVAGYVFSVLGARIGQVTNDTNVGPGTTNAQIAAGTSSGGGTK